MYEPTALKQAVEHIQTKRRNRLADGVQPLQLDDRYRRLFANMGQVPPIRAEGLGYCLEPREIVLLCEYLFSEAKDFEKDTLGKALLESLDKESTATIYRKCLDNYDDEAFKPMFAQLHVNRQFLKALEDAFDFRAEPVMNALRNGTIVEFLNNEAGVKASATEGGYAEVLNRYGVPKTSKLYLTCMGLYVVVCDAKEYRRIGPDTLKKAADDFDDDKKLRLLRNMLTVLDDYQLRQFVSMLDDFIALTGEPDSKNYRDALFGVSEVNRKKYAKWISQYIIYKTFNGDARSKFWLEYIDRCSVSTHGGSGALLLNFGKFTVIEFKTDIAAYFYDNEYFKKHVLDGLALTKSELELETWLREKTEWASQGDNLMHWRKAHAGSWQLDMREYISKYSN